jgi:beta-glucosidase/6-phospho-beta-glucosidase/beta-galactosidase
VIWDLFHYGWPDGVDPWSDDMVERFAAFARAAAQVIGDRTDGAPWFCPVNEISFLSWAGGDKGEMNPFAHGRGGELKAQLVRMAIAATRAVREVCPDARFITAEPLVNIIPQSGSEDHVRAAAGHMEGQYEAVDMLSGRRSPELGGSPDLLDVYGVNVYFNNQWVDHGRPVVLGDPLFQPLREQLAAAYEHYGRPLLIAETGTEGVFRAAWLHYMADEVAAAIAAGIPVLGLCLYPVLSHRGWDDQRHCPNGLFAGFAPDADRAAYRPLADELARQQDLFARGVLVRD